jgi:hypothetical protein
MKKIYFSIVSIGAALLFVACSNALDNEVEPQESNAPVIYASQERPAKSSITVDGEGVGTIYWSPADDISVFYGASTPVLYTSTNTAPETTAAFTTNSIIGSTELASTNIWGLYPHNPSAVCNGTSITTTLPATQHGVSGTFDDDLFLTVAHSDNTNLHFFNVCGGIKFSLSRDDITSITFSGNNNEDIAGDITVSFVDGLPSVSVVNGVKTITLTPKDGGTFASGTYYYIVALPQTLSQGFTMAFDTSTGYVGTFNYTTSSIGIKRTVFSKKANIDTYAEFIIPTNCIVYTTLDGNIIDLTSVANASLISNIYSNGIGIMTFDKTITAITNMTRPDGFRERTNLVTVVLPNSVESIGNYAFYGCSNLTSIVLTDRVVNNPSACIGNCAFLKCSKLQEITIPSGLRYIYNNVLTDCTSLNKITILDTTPTDLGNSAFDNTGNCPIYVPAESINLYKTASKWSAYADRYQAIP